MLAFSFSGFGQRLGRLTGQRHAGDYEEIIESFNLKRDLYRDKGVKSIKYLDQEWKDTVTKKFDKKGFLILQCEGEIVGEFSYSSDSLIDKIIIRHGADGDLIEQLSFFYKRRRLERIQAKSENEYIIEFVLKVQKGKTVRQIIKRNKKPQPFTEIFTETCQNFDKYKICNIELDKKKIRSKLFKDGRLIEEDIILYEGNSVSSLVNINEKTITFGNRDSVLTSVSTAWYNDSTQAGFVSHWYKDGMFVSSSAFDLGFLKPESGCIRWTYEYTKEKLLLKEICSSCTEENLRPFFVIEYFYEYW